MQTTIIAIGLMAGMVAAKGAAFRSLYPGEKGVLPPVTARTTGAGLAAWTPGGTIAGVALLTDLDGFAYVVEESSRRVVAAIAPGAVMGYGELFPVPAVLSVSTVYYLIVDTALVAPGDLAPTAPYLKTESFVLAVPEPEVTVLLGAAVITDGQAAAIEFGVVSQGGVGPTRTFTVRNDGVETLELSTLSKPTGYTITEGLATSLAPGASDTFTVRLDSGVVGAKSGQISFTNNDSDENPFNFPVTGQVLPAGEWRLTVDDNDTTGVSVVGGWNLSTTVPNYWDAGYLHDGNTGQGTKSVTFRPNLPAAGRYHVYLWWTAQSNRASNVPVDVAHSGGTATVTVNQRLNGARWNLLGTWAFAQGSAGAVQIRTTSANGVVVADAVKFTPEGCNVVDDFDQVSNLGSVSYTGAWPVSVGVSGYWDSGGYHHDGNVSKGTKSVRFQPNLAAAGSYQVSLWYTAHSGRASNVPVDVIHSGGTTTVIVNQRSNGAQWNALGTFAFTAGTGGSVLIRTTGTDGVVVADAVRFVQVSGLQSEPGAELFDEALAITGPGEMGTGASRGDGVALGEGIGLASVNRMVTLEARMTDGHLVVDYVRMSDNAGVEYVMEGSDDLVTWVPMEARLRETVASMDATSERVQIHELVPLTGTAVRFYRLRVLPSQ